MAFVKRESLVKNVDLSPALSKPAMVSAVLLSSLKRLLAEGGSEGLASEIVSISEKDGAISIRATGPLVASALRLRQGAIETAFSETLARFGRKGTTTVKIR